jgi:hypothetical protein
MGNLAGLLVVLLRLNSIVHQILEFVGLTFQQPFLQRAMMAA